MKNLVKAGRRYLGRLKHRLLNTAPAAPESPFLKYPPGHYYSPLPDTDAVDRLSTTVKFSKSLTDIPGIKINGKAQRDWLTRAVAEFGGLPIGEQGHEIKRYIGENPFFEYADAWSGYAMMRRYRPRHIIEVGSGFSSALMLDVNDGFLDGKTRFTFIEPYPERLFGLLRPNDREQCEVLVQPVQDVPMEKFMALRENDILFIDSSHVSKVGSDVNFLFHEVIPRLAPGVIIHVHDVLWPFEYPLAWFHEGRAWNEAYMLRSFLQFNDTFEILLHNSYLKECSPELFAGEMKGFIERPGGSFWMRKIR